MMYKYLAVVTQNGLWIRDKIQDKTLVIILLELIKII